MKKIAILAILVIAMLSTMALAMAAAPGAGDVVTDTDKGAYVYTATDQNTSVTSGLIKNLDLKTNMSTYRWAGLYGNVTGNIILGDSSNNQLFHWTAKGRVVYATTAASVTWGSVVAEDGSHVATFYNGASDSDNYASTFTGSEAVPSGILSVAAAPTATSLGGTTGWKTYALYDGTSVVFAGNVIAAGESAYDGTSTINYQMIVPEDGTANNATATNYNLWVELQ